MVVFSAHHSNRLRINFLKILCRLLASEIGRRAPFLPGFGINTVKYSFHCLGNTPLLNKELNNSRIRVCNSVGNLLIIILEIRSGPEAHLIFNVAIASWYSLVEKGVSMNPMSKWSVSGMDIKR